MSLKHSVTVRNEYTGEQRTVEVGSGYWADAQVEALILLFRTEGWSKAVALEPLELRHQASA